MTRLALLGIAAEGPTLAPRLAPCPAAADPAAFVAHHRQVVAQAEAGHFLPAPWGIAFENPAGADAAIDRHALILADRLASLGGGVEWLLRGTLAPEAEVPETGRDFLKARARRQAGQARLAAEAGARAVRLEAEGSRFVAQRKRGDDTLDLIFWMDRGWTRPRLAALLAGAAEGLCWRLTEPWPAYAAAGLAPLFLDRRTRS